MNKLLRLAAPISIVALFSLFAVNANQETERTKALRKFKTITNKTNYNSRNRLEMPSRPVRIAPQSIKMMRSEAKSRTVNVSRNLVKSQAKMASMKTNGSIEAFVAEKNSAATASLKGTMSGIILKSDATTPADYFSLYVYDNYGEYAGYIYTDDVGAYTSDSLVVGTYYLVSENSQYHVTYYPGVGDPAEATLITVAEGADTPNIDMTLLARFPVEISGHVYQADGTTPIDSADIFIIPVDARYFYNELSFDEPGLKFGFTDVDGAYSFNYGAGVDVVFGIKTEGYMASFYMASGDTEPTLVTIADDATVVGSIDFIMTPMTVAEEDGNEQNNTSTDATAIAYGDSIRGRMDPTGDVDWFTFSGTLGDTITTWVDADMIGSAMDPYLFLYDSDAAAILAEDDNALYSTYGLDAHIESFVLPYSGVYFLKLIDFFSDGGEDFFYDIWLHHGTPPPASDDPGTVVDNPDENEPNDDVASATMISFPDTVEAFGWGPDGYDTDIYEFQGTMDEVISIDALTSRVGNHDMSVQFWVYDSSGGYLVGGDSFRNAESRLSSYVVPYTGRYYLYVSLSLWEDDLMPEETNYTLYLFEGPFNDVGYISGAVADASGEEFTDADWTVYIYAITERGWDYAGTANVDGTSYSSPGLLAGDYILELYTDNSDGGFYLEYSWYEGDTPGMRAEVAVVAGDTTKNIDFVAGIEGGAIKGFVTFPTGFRSDDNWQTEIVAYGTTGSIDFGWLTFVNGYRVGPIFPGEYQLANLHLFTSLPPTYFGGGGTFGDAANTTVTTISGANTTADLAASAAGPGSISGTVYLEADSAISFDNWEGYVVAYDASGHIYQVGAAGYDFLHDEETNDGEYSLNGLNEGTYNLMLLAFWLGDGSSNVDSIVGIWYDDPTSVDLMQSDEDGDVYVQMIPLTTTAIVIATGALDIVGVDFSMDAATSPVVSIDGEQSLPTAYALHQNYPNPFNPTTTLNFDLPNQVDMALVVYDLMGREVVTLSKGNLEAGFHQIVWNGRDNNGRQMPSGLYFARMQTATFTKSIKMVLLK